jgi:zinc transporter ZupT
VVGLLVGVLPIAIGLACYPLIRQASPATTTFLLALTGGVLIFLAVDASAEGLELAASAPAALNATAAFVVAVAAALGALLGLRHLLRSRRRFAAGLGVATLIAVGIGMHNLGEGLAIGAAYAIGAVSLTTALVVGFAVHNTTEGLAVVTPLGSVRPHLLHFVGLCLIAGVPTVVGAWVGALVYSPVLAIVSLGLGVGAIFQVLVELAALVRSRRALSEPSVVSGVIAGLVLMYLTSLVALA